MRSTNIYMTICGLLAFVLSIMVMFGWHLGHQSLVQIHPSFAPMQFNTALGFFCGSLSLVFLAFQKTRVSRVFAFCTFALGALSLSQYLFSYDLGIDRLFAEPVFDAKTSHPGRMAPNTAMGFVFLGAALLCQVVRRTVFVALTFAVLALGITALLGYALKFEPDSLHGWAALTRMAIHTASLFIVLGAGCLIYGVMAWEEEQFDVWNILPISLALVVAVLTMFSSYIIEEETQARNQAYFDGLIDDTERILADRYKLYEKALRGGLGLYYASDTVTREEWKSYVRALEVETSLPGINGIGYIDYVPSAALPDYLEVSRKDSAPNFKNYPQTDFDDKFIIKFIEPVARNIEAVGLDIGFEAHRRAAAERARDTGQAALTEKILLVQDHKKQAGFLLLLPHYAGERMPASIKERRAQLRGWVYAPFIGPNFFEGISDINRKQIDLTVFDDEALTEEAVIYASADYQQTHDQKRPHTSKDIKSKVTQMSFAGRTWTLVWRSNDEFKPPANKNAALWVMIYGLAFAAFLFLTQSKLLQSRESIRKQVIERTAKLKAASDFQDLVTDSIPDFVFVKDSEYRIVQANEAFLNLYPQDIREHVIGSTTVEKYNEKEAEAFLENDKLTFQNGYTEVEEKLTMPDGKERTLLTKKVRFKNEAGEVFLLAVARDITEAKKAQKQVLKANAELERASQLKSEFLANMSHEIRTPLNGIIGATDLMRRTNISGEQEQYLGIITSSGGTLLTLINDILDISKIEAGEMDIHPEPVDLPAFIDDILKSMSARAAEKRLELKTDYKGNVPKTIRADRMRLSQIMINLLGNALKFTEKGYVAVSVEEVKTADGRCKLRFSVEDTGIGIQNSQIGNIFDKFAQADATTTKKYGGTGLGLAITHRLVELMGGFIGVESSPGEGTTFFFELDVDIVDGDIGDSEGRALRDMTVTGKDGPERTVTLKDVNPHILLVENELVNQMVATSLLQGLGCRVDLAEDGAQAIEKYFAGDSPYDAILMDCMMPVMDGYEATTEIRRRETEEGLAPSLIIAMTANAMAGERDKCLAVGMNDYLAKPVREEDLRVKLLEYLGRDTETA